MEYKNKNDRSKLVELYGEDIIIQFEKRLEDYLQTSNKKYKDKKSVLLNWIKKDNITTIKELEEQKEKVIKSNTLYDSEGCPYMKIYLTADGEKHYSIIN